MLHLLGWNSFWISAKWQSPPSLSCLINDTIFFSLFWSDLVCLFKKSRSHVYQVGLKTCIKGYFLWCHATNHIMNAVITSVTLRPRFSLTFATLYTEVGQLIHQAKEENGPFGASACIVSVFVVPLHPGCGSMYTFWNSILLSNKSPHTLGLPG